MIVGRREEFEALADYVLRDYLGDSYDICMPFPIASFAKNYLKLQVAYYPFPPESRISGMRSGRSILLDSRLSDYARFGERNFTIAHECGHELVNLQENDSESLKIDFRIRHSGRRLVTDSDFREWQANVVGAYLLLRPVLVEKSLRTILNAEKFVFEGEKPHGSDRENLHRLALFLQVSDTCLLYRLEQLALLERRS